ncbi:hypothetical protein AGLY_007040 [Aphis glycines]|uniref:Uncharacterized protein n=1 Tax=Aphis glycines TaxID=307491 RepID=A0A6G0TQQ5_APHGL|nr:hypothetical protein AGLY_007040 [Aphis glycines]
MPTGIDNEKSGGKTQNYRLIGTRPILLKKCFHYIMFYSFLSVSTRGCRSCHVKLYTAGTGSQNNMLIEHASFLSSENKQNVYNSASARRVEVLLAVVVAEGKLRATYLETKKPNRASHKIKNGLTLPSVSKMYSENIQNIEKKEVTILTIIYNFQYIVMFKKENVKSENDHRTCFGLQIDSREIESMRLRTATGSVVGGAWVAYASMATWAGAGGGGVVVPLPTADAGVGDGDSFLDRLSGCW